MERLLAIGDVRELKGVRHLHDRPVDGVAPGALRHPRRPDAGRVPRRSGRRGAARRRRRSTGKRFLLPRADIARDLLADELRDAGADVVEVVAYRTMPRAGDRDGGAGHLSACCSTVRSTP